ncbi:type II toxin-antitoxin system RelE/ParE family toxin [uncultured Sphingomonas sp.]|uniref:type II toxin-antitoxin system RelE/ParE family toxin n=1 Tax=uncultured Sphingomonas sp. TaxID=158754 RepID=UPI0035C96668
MPRIFKNAWFQRFARRERIDDAMLIDAVARAGRGLIDADLGGGVIKQRVARPGAGRSGGYRALLFFRSGDRAVFAFGFAKNRRDNVSEAELALLKQAAGVALGWHDAALDRLVETGILMEIDHDGQD